MLNLTGWMLVVLTNLLSFETGNSGLFIGIAQSAMTAIGIVMVLMFGLRAMQAVESGQPFMAGGYLVIGLKLGFCLAVITGWNVPAPGLGSPIGTWIPNFGLTLAKLVTWSGAQDIAQNVASWSGIEVPGNIFSVGMFWWLLAQVILFLTTVMMAAVLVGPLIIVACLVVIGPVFISLWLIPELTVYARGYVRCLVTYSLVPVIAAAAMRIIAQILLPSVGNVSGVVTSAEGFLPQAFMMCISLIAAIWVMLKCISVANHVTSGSSGTGSGWFSAGVSALKAAL